MQLITSAAKLSKAFQDLLASCATLHLAVAWASVGFPEHDELLRARRKIGRVVVGTHFYQTAPDFITTFVADERVRFITDHSGVFHPKLYLFEGRGDRWSCIVGSANFTTGGFGRNEEACLLVTEADDPDGTVLADARAAIGRYWKDAVPGTAIDLDGYREMCKRLARPLAHAVGQFGTRRPGFPGFPIEQVGVLNMNWDEFMARVRRDRHHSLDRRLDVLRAARDLFRKHGSLAGMSREDRQRIAGFGGTTKHPGAGSAACGAPGCSRTG